MEWVIFIWFIGALIIFGAIVLLKPKVTNLEVSILIILWPVILLTLIILAIMNKMDERND
jgi:cytochrome c-type biogenesis protein CcmH/NrfF